MRCTNFVSAASTSSSCACSSSSRTCCRSCDASRDAVASEVTSSSPSSALDSIFASDESFFCAAILLERSFFAERSCNKNEQFATRSYDYCTKVMEQKIRLYSTRFQSEIYIIGARIRSYCTKLLFTFVSQFLKAQKHLV